MMKPVLVSSRYLDSDGRWFLMAATVSLIAAGTSCGTSRYSSGHPLESTTVESWELEGDTATVHVSLRDDAPSYGCLLEAFDEKGTSIGYAIAKPMGQEKRSLVLKIDEEHRASDVDDVKVTDCDM